MKIESFIYFRHQIKLDSQPQGIDINSNGLIAVACINQVNRTHLF